MFKTIKRPLAFLTLIICLLLPAPAAAQTSSSGSVGIEATVPTGAPTVGATISVPTNGQVFTSIPIQVSGLCTGDVLVKLFKNNVFTGSAQCKNGSFSLQADLFNGQNDLIARVYDALDQAGPDSNTVSITFNDPVASLGNRVTLTSNYAKRGANPNETLEWPISISGGVGPYAISVDWQDGTSPDLLTQPFPGTFNISHIYKASGVYNVIVKAADANNSIAFIQLVAIANGPIAQTNDLGIATKEVTKVIWLPVLIALPLIFIAFWLGRRHQLYTLQHRQD